MKLSTDTAKCKGEAPNGTQVCGYRERCLRFIAKDKGHYYETFWRAGDDCPQYLSVPKAEIK